MLGQPKDNTVTGERISKDYRDRYANFSKGAHFSFGGQGKNKNTSSYNHVLLNLITPANALWIAFFRRK